MTCPPDRVKSILHDAEDLAHVGSYSAKLVDLVDLAGNYDRARSLLEDALQAFGQRWDQRGLGYTYILLGDFQRRVGDRPNARESLKVGLKLARDERDVEQAWAVLHEVNRDGEAGPVLLELAKLALVEEDDARTKSRPCESLSLLRQGGSRLDLSDCLATFGRVLVKVGERERGVRLIGAAATLDSMFWTSRNSGERSSYEACLATARNALGDEAFAQAWAGDKAMMLDKAIADALF